MYVIRQTICSISISNKPSSKCQGETPTTTTRPQIQNSTSDVYRGPHLEDPNEPISEAEDFERFKMQTCMEKIVEFHQAHTDENEQWGSLDSRREGVYLRLLAHMSTLTNCE